MTTQYVTTSDGTRIAYDVTGNGPGLMLLHGAGKSRQDWHTLGYVDQLQKDFTVIAVDIRGSGESAFLIDIADYTIEKICDDLNAVADACGIRRFAVWGFSFGGNVARYLGTWSKRVIAMVIVGVPFGLAVDNESEQHITDFVKKWQPVVDAYKEGSLTEEGRQAALQGRIPVWLACLQAMRQWPRIEPGEIHCPALLLVGAENKSTLRWVKSNQEVLDNAHIQIEIVAGIDHNQEFNEIERVFPVISQFLKDAVPEKDE